MATYEVEHNIPSPPPATTTSSTSPTPHPRRPDLSTFFSNFEQVDTSSTTNAHAVPIPSDVSAAYRSLADVYEYMRQDRQGGGAGGGGGGGDGGGRGHGNGEEGEGEGGLLARLVEELMGEAEVPPRSVKGVSEEWLADLERIPKKKLKDGDVCPICNNPFLDDPYPLVVRLPCHPSHIFDLECIQPWLKLHPTCPLDRKDLLEKKQEVAVEKKEEEEEDGEWDDMYA